MKILFIFCSFFLGWFEKNLPDESHPQSSISNGILRAELYLPDAAKGYYQGSRFDWSGAFKSLDSKKHSYVGQWFKNYDPKMHDAISGPVEEFGPMGYEEAAVGETFIKIGVGALRRINGKAYTPFVLYDVVNPGQWKIKQEKDRVVFNHLLTDKTGYAYSYQKTVRLVKDKSELVLEHVLKNTGNRTIVTSVYDHNFFIIDKEVTGPNIKIKFPFQPEGTGRGLGSFAEIRGNEINYTRTLREKEDMYIGEVKGFRPDAQDYDFRIENLRSGGGVRIRSDQALDKLVFWACPTVSCPEPYIRIVVEPGEEFRWKIWYEVI